MNKINNTRRQACKIGAFKAWTRGLFAIPHWMLSIVGAVHSSYSRANNISTGSKHGIENDLEDSTSNHEFAEVLDSAVRLRKHFEAMMRGWPRRYCYTRRFGCGAEGSLYFKHFRKSTLMTLRWGRPCQCHSKAEREQCRLKLRRWLTECEGQEVTAKRFRFPHEGSLTMDLGEMGTIIFPVIYEQNQYLRK